MGKKKKINPEGGAAEAPSSGTSFKVGDNTYDFNRKEFYLPGEGLVNVDQLLKEDEAKFEALCAKLVEMESGFIHIIE